MNPNENSVFDQGVSFSTAIPNQYQYSMHYSNQDRGSADALISGYVVDESSVVKEENSLLEFSKRSQPRRNSEQPTTNACKREYESESGSPQLPAHLPPTKRPHNDSPLNSASNSSSDAQSPPDLLVGDGNVFNNRAFQMGDDYSAASLEESFELQEPDWSQTDNQYNERVDQSGQIQQPSPTTDGFCSYGLQRTLSERVPGQRFHPRDPAAPATFSEQRPLTFESWSEFPIGTLLEVVNCSGPQQQQQQLATRQADTIFSVQADKGFQFSGREGVWISQKKNHFQITCIVGVSGHQWAVPIAPSHDDESSCTVQLVRSFQLSLTAVRAESPFESPPIALEQAEANRTRRQFVTQPLSLPGQGVRVRAVAGRLHFTSATLNNQRRRGELHPDQRFFRLAVGIDAVLESGLAVPLCRQLSGRVIVRASNPGQFEASSATAAGTADAAAEQNSTTEEAQPAADGWRFPDKGVAAFAGRVGINTTTPGEALTVSGNLQLNGNLLQPSDARIKAIEDELQPADQLANISQLRIYNYRRLDGGPGGVGASHSSRDTGVIAQEVAGVLPDAVRKSSTQLVPTTGEPLLLVNKDRIYMENVGAVKQLGELTASLDKRIGELERMRSQLCRVRDSLRAPASPEQQRQQQQTGRGGAALTRAPEAGSSYSAEQSKSADESRSWRSSTACGMKIATLAIAVFALISCCFCATAVILLVSRIAPAVVSTAPLETTSATTASMTSLTPESTVTATTDRQTSKVSPSTLKTSTKLPIPTSSKQPNDGIIRPDSCNGAGCRPVPCCHSASRQNLSMLNKQRPLRQANQFVESTDVAIWKLGSARLASANLGEWSLTVGSNAACEAAGDIGSRLALQFDHSNCRGSNMTLKLMLDASFPTEAELHLRLKTNLTCDYCQPSIAHDRCPSSQSDGKLIGGCVPVSDWGCDCNLGRAAAHLRHLATLRLTPTGLPPLAATNLVKTASYFASLKIAAALMANRGPYQKISQLDRERIVRAYRSGDDWEELGRMMGMKKPTVRNIVTTYERTGRVGTLPKGGVKRMALTEAMVDTIVQFVEGQPTASHASQVPALDQPFPDVLQSVLEC
uniref:NDT80 domain-containing protein n=1 Tax=Macrostomum lignano TaxID=282301 RepID=A0A1I8JLQ8_9PLAT